MTSSVMVTFEIVSECEFQAQLELFYKYMESGDEHAGAKVVSVEVGQDE